VLETKSFDSWADEGQHLIHGDGTTLWFDKSLTLVFFSNGRMGINGEHSWGDAPVVGHASEYNLTTELV
jgi:Choline/Carnitine o-acyltransferase